MDVLFLTLYPESAASPRYRVHQFIPYLEARGVHCTVVSAIAEDAYARFTGPNRSGRAFWYHAHETPRRIQQLLSARRYDVVVLQKAITSAYVRGLGSLLRRSAKRLVYDIDDAVHLRAPHQLRAPWQIVENQQQMAEIMANADLVLAGNRWLVEETETLGGKAAHFPTVVDTERFVPAPKAPEAFTVGWMGNPSTAASLAPLHETLSSLPDARVVAVGAAAGQLPDAVETRSWNVGQEVADLQGFSVGLMPLTPGDWARGKCALKSLQYLACGVPCISTPFGAALDALEDGVTGLFAETPAQWREAIETLRDADTRRRMGSAGRAMVEKRFSLAKAAPQLLQHLESVR